MLFLKSRHSYDFTKKTHISEQSHSNIIIKCNTTLYGSEHIWSAFIIFLFCPVIVCTQPPCFVHHSEKKWVRCLFFHSFNKIVLSHPFPNSFDFHKKGMSAFPYSFFFFHFSLFSLSVAHSFTCTFFEFFFWAMDPQPAKASCKDTFLFSFKLHEATLQPWEINKVTRFLPV